MAICTIQHVWHIDSAWLGLKPSPVPTMPRGTALFIFSWLALLIFTLSHTPHRRVRGGGGRCAGCGLCLFNAIHSPCPQHITPSPPPKTLTAPKTHTHAPSGALSLSLSAGSVKHSSFLASINHKLSLSIVTAQVAQNSDTISTLTTASACDSLCLSQTCTVRRSSWSVITHDITGMFCFYR